MRFFPLAGLLAAALVAATPLPARGDEGEPAKAGPPSRATGRAFALFEAGRWLDAAPDLFLAERGRNQDRSRERQRARFYLGVSLHRLELREAALRVFGAVAADPGHLGFRDAARWLTDLDDELSDGARVHAHVAAYPIRSIALVGDPRERERASHLHYLIGKNARESRDFERAAAAFDEVARESPRYPAAQILGGMALVEMRRPRLGARRMLRAVEAIPEDERDPQRRGLRELALISAARAEYTSVEPGFEGRVAIASNALSRSVKYWSRIDTESALWPSAQLESSWAYFWAGDHARVIGNLVNLESGYWQVTLYPEADVLRGLVAYTLCRYDDALGVIGRMRKRYLPVRSALAARVAEIARGADDRVAAIPEDLRENRGSLPAELRPLAAVILGDRGLQALRGYLAEIAAEEARLARLPEGFRRSELGADVAAGLARARAETIARRAARVRALHQRWLDDIDAQLRQMSALLVDVNRAKAMERPGEMVVEPLILYGVVTPDVEHTIWPFDGEYWKDEIGSYRGRMESRCRR
jgi:hypothetical protein